VLHSKTPRLAALTERRRFGALKATSFMVWR
jgi:hypothetical protein